ncbi:MAG TPA: O-antigen ligase family protein [Thermoleophilaceae bacterium]
MATTEARPAQLPPPLLRARSLDLRTAPPVLLGAAVFVAAVYAAFANGAIGIPDETRLQVGVAGIAILTIAALLFGSSLRAAARAPAYAGLALLGAFAAWCAISLTWSIQPDQSWLEFNRAFSYMLVAGLGLVLGASLPQAPRRAAVGWLVIATVVALYALGGKALPWLIHSSGSISRLREPIGYWNGLAILLVMAVPAGLAAAADVARSERGRLVALLALVPLLVGTVLALSRGALLTLVAVLLLQFALAEDRGRLLPLAFVALVGSIPALLVGLTLHDLTTDNISVHARTGDGLILLAAFVAGLVAAAAIGRVTIRSRAKLAVPGGARMALAAALLMCVVVVIGAALSGGSASSQRPGRVNNPSRLLQANSSHRVDWWREAIDAWADRPVLGYGAGSFPRLHELYRKDPLVDVTNAHSLPLELLAETGLAGALLLLGGLALLALAAVRGVLARPDGYAIALLAAAAAFALHSLVDWDWDIPAVALPALAFLGLLAARSREQPQRTTAWRGRPSMSAGRRGYAVGLGAATLLLALAIGSALLPAIAKQRSDDAFFASLTGNHAQLVKAAEDAESASRLDPFSVEPLLAGSAVAQKLGDYRRSGQLLHEAIARQPDNPDAWYELARLETAFDNVPAGYTAALTAFTLDRGDDNVRALLRFLVVDDRLSATATGTPLPKKQPQAAAPAPAPSTSTTPTPSQPNNTTTAPQTTTPAPQPTPAPAPAPSPAPAPPKNNQNFELDG